MKAWYDKVIMPRIVSVVCGTASVRRERAKIVPQAQGVVLDVGIGAGHNLALFDPNKVSQVLGLDPTPEMVARGKVRFEKSPIPVEVIHAGAEDIPMGSASVDTAVLAFTGCTIPAIEEALEELRRVLKPSGRLLFVEHGLSPDPKVARWQHRLDGAWGLFSGGCHLNRDLPALLADAGFTTEHLETTYGDGPKFASHLFIGAARP